MSKTIDLKLLKTNINEFINVLEMDEKVVNYLAAFYGYCKAKNESITEELRMKLGANVK